MSDHEEDDYEEDFDFDDEENVFVTEEDILHYYKDPNTFIEYNVGDQVVYKATVNQQTQEKDIFHDVVQGIVTIDGESLILGFDCLFAPHLVLVNITAVEKHHAAYTIQKAWKRWKALKAIQRKIAARIIQRFCLSWMYTPLKGVMYKKTKDHFGASHIIGL